MFRRIKLFLERESERIFFFSSPQQWDEILLTFQNTTCILTVAGLISDSLHASCILTMIRSLLVLSNNVFSIPASFVILSYKRSLRIDLRLGMYKRSSYFKYLLYVIEVSHACSNLLLATWLNCESISQPANFAHLLILPFSVFPLYAHTRLVKGHFLMLRRQSGTLSLTKSDHPTPSHPSNHHLKLIFFQQSYWLCVCGGEEMGRERGEREKERDREWARELVV